jgi:hypothetical protein
MLLNNKYLIKSSIIYIFTLVLFIIKLGLKSVILILNIRNKGFKAIISLIKLLVKVLKSLFYTFILKLFKVSLFKPYKVFFKYY